MRDRKVAMVLRALADVLDDDDTEVDQQVRDTPTEAIEIDLTDVIPKTGTTTLDLFLTYKDGSVIIKPVVDGAWPFGEYSWVSRIKLSSVGIMSIEQTSEWVARA